MGVSFGSSNNVNPNPSEVLYDRGLTDQFEQNTSRDQWTLGLDAVLELQLNANSHTPELTHCLGKSILTNFAFRIRLPRQ
jgi:hypothetical protein